MVTPNRVMCDVSLCFHPARDVTAAAVEPALQATCNYSNGVIVRVSVRGA
jgi:hypothetical protein